MRPPRPTQSVDPLTWATLGVRLPETPGSYVPVECHPKQRQFLALDHLEAMYGGAAGGGKSEALLADALQYVHYPHYKALVLRRTYPELAKPGSIMHRAIGWLGREFFNDRDKRFTFPSGAIIQFGYCNSDSDLGQYKSSQFHRVYIDELTEWPEAWYVYLFSRVRRTKGDPIPLAMRTATNPDGIGAEWVRRRFGIPEAAIVERPIENRREDRIFVPARADDNPYLDLEAYEKALSKLSTSKYKQLRWGQWIRDGEGLVYKDFDDKRNVLTIDDEAKEAHFVDSLDFFLLGLDFGFVDATAFAILGWRSHDPTVYVVAAWKERGLIPSEVAEIVHDLEAERPFDRIVGDLGGLGKGYAEEARVRWRVPIEPADKKNKRGYIDLLNGDLKRGRLRLVMPRCEELRKEWNELPWDERRAEEATGFDNHLADATLYAWRAVTAYRETPRAKKPKPGSPEHDQASVEAHREARRRDLERASTRAAARSGKTTRERWQPGQGGTSRWGGRSP